MTPSQLQTAKEILEHHGYRVIFFHGHMAMKNRDHDVFKLRYVKEEDKICIMTVAGFFSVNLIKREFAEVKEVVLDLQLNGVPVER